MKCTMNRQGNDGRSEYGQIMPGNNQSDFRISGLRSSILHGHTIRQLILPLLFWPWFRVLNSIVFICIFLDGKCYTPVDLVLALDASGSVKLNNWEKEVEFAKQLISNFDVSKSGTHIGVIDFSQAAKPRVDLNSNAGKQVGKINEILESLKEDYQNGMTYTDLALKEAFKMFQNVPASRTVPKLFIVVTDGFTTWRKGKTGMQLLHQPVKDLQGSSVKTYSVAVGNQVDDEELELMANNIDDHVLKLNNFDGLLGIIKELTTVACPSK